MNPNVIALRRAAALMGPDRVSVTPEPPAKAGSPQDTPAGVSQQATRKRGRPRGGIREAARLAGVPESYYRRHMGKYVPPEIARLAGYLAPCVKFSPAAWLKIMRCETQLERLHTIRQLARAARQPRPPTPTERLKSRIRELETIVRNQENELRGYRNGSVQPVTLTIGSVKVNPGKSIDWKDPPR